MSCGPFVLWSTTYRTWNQNLHAKRLLIMKFSFLTEIRKWRSLYRDEVSWLLETFTFLKYTFEENFILSAEFSGFSICGYVGDNVECWRVCFNTNFTWNFSSTEVPGSIFIIFQFLFSMKVLKWTSFMSHAYFDPPISAKVWTFYAVFKKIFTYFIPLCFVTTNEKNGWHLIHRSVVCFFKDAECY